MSPNKKIPCKYGDKCYQKNPVHLNKYSHSIKRTQTTNNNLRAKKAKHIDDKFKDAEPVKVDDVPKTDVDLAEARDSENVEDTQIHEDNSVSTGNSSIDKHLSSNNDNVVFVETGATLEDKKLFIKEKFLVDMPEDFYSFWDLCKTINKDNPKDAFKDARLILAGPYDVLADCLPKKDDEQYLLHCRYYYDTPEFQTILIEDSSTGFHLGYFRDSPEEKPVFVGSNQEKKDCKIVQMGENVFGAVNTYLEDMKSKANPFRRMIYEKLLSKVQNKAKELDIDISKSTPAMQKRNRKCVCKSYHAAGIVVPFNRKTQVGYRDLFITEKELQALLDRIARASADKKQQVMAELQPVLNATMIANDECDFGTSLHLGTDLFCHGDQFLNNTALRLLSTAYTLLHRHVFAKIASVHLKNRNKLALSSC